MQAFSTSQEICFPRAKDPFREFSSLSFEQMIAQANQSKHDGYAPFTADISPISHKEWYHITTLAALSEETDFSKSFYSAILKGHIIQIKGEKAFIHQCQTAISALLQKPLGRSLLLTIYRIGVACIIEQGETAHVGARGTNKPITCLHIFLPLKPLYYVAEVENSRRVLHVLPSPILMAHELLHGIQKASLCTRAKTQEIADTIVPAMFTAPSEDPFFPSIIERITILGVNGKLPSENAFHFAFGTPKACRYQTSAFPPILSKIPSILTKDEQGQTRIERAAFLGLKEEVFLLLEKGESREEALKGAIAGNECALVQCLLPPAYEATTTKLADYCSTMFYNLCNLGPLGVSSTS